MTEKKKKTDGKMLHVDLVKAREHIIFITIYAAGQQHPSVGDMITVKADIELPADDKSTPLGGHYPLIDDLCFGNRLPALVVDAGPCEKYIHGYFESSIGSHKETSPGIHARVCTFTVNGYSWNSAIKSAVYRAKKALQPLVDAIERREDIMRNA